MVSTIFFPNEGVDGWNPSEKYIYHNYCKVLASLLFQHYYKLSAPFNIKLKTIEIYASNHSFSTDEIIDQC
jgi:hypothetical protein